ncbi:MAG: ligase [Labilithrix sp.]|nr:ligase [Labilithrix sp.]
MQDLADGETTTVKGSGSAVYTLKNSGGVYSCTCPAWMHQSIGIERRTCKHLRAFRSDDAEKERLGTAELTGKPARPPRAPKAAGEGDDARDDEDDAPPLLLAHKWETEIDIAGWWLSEKLDGVRAYWDGKQFLSRLGNRFYPPPWFVEQFPDTPLDGELWGGRKLFQRTVGIVKRQDQSPLWKDLLFVVFDAPAHPGAFEERIEHARNVIAERKIPYARIHEQYVCRDHDHLREELTKVEALGGEGLMARKPGSKYEVGRSSTLLKVKTFHDAEARVVAHAAGAGKHKGRLGALVVELADGTRFNVGTGFSDAERESPPAVGSIVTFRYQELSDAGVPRFPSFVGVRIDAKEPSTLVTPRAPGAAQARPTAAPTVSAGAARVAASPAPVAAAVRAPVRRRFEMEDGDTRYFWEIETVGTKHRVRYGTFEAKVKTFGSEAESREALEQRIAEKVGKGFVEVESDSG